jgi:hypothetical protein
MVTKDKVTELFCIIDEFCKQFEKENANKTLLTNLDKTRRRRSASMLDSEIMTIMFLFHFGTFCNFKHFYLFYVKECLKSDFPRAVSYNRFVELEGRVFFQLMFFLNIRAFGRCTGIIFVDSTMIPVCHNMRRYKNKVFKGFVTDGKGTMGWCHGFKLHFHATTEGRLSPLSLLEPMWMIKIQKCGRLWLKSFMENYLPIKVTSHKSFSKACSKTGYIS